MAVPADGEIGTERDLRRALRAANRDLPFAPLRRDLMLFRQLFAQLVGSLFEGEAPIIQHEAVVGAAHRARDMVEVRVLIGMQPDHLAERQQQAEGENGEHHGLPAHAVFPEPVHRPGESHARDHGHWRNHENEMPDAIIERRALHHRDQQR